jgi:hypothetical protein
MALQYLQIGDKSRPVLFGNTAYRLYCESEGITMAQLASDLNPSTESENYDAGLTLKRMAGLSYYALRCGEMRVGFPKEDYTQEIVSLWLDEFPGGADAFYLMALNALPKPQAGEGEAEPGEAQESGTGTS